MDNNLKYKCLNYWNERYKSEDSFEWFADYDKFKSILNAKLIKTDRILVLGCGNSKMSEDMYRDGFRRIVNTDYSPIIIELMTERCKELDEMTWEVKDINALDYESETFECVLEKGTLDALLVDETDPWRLSDENSAKLDNILLRVKIFIFILRFPSKL